jgi:hypothetical protein
MPRFKTRPGEPILPEMEIAGLGIAMIAISVILLVWAFPNLPRR